MAAKDFSDAGNQRAPGHQSPPRGNINSPAAAEGTPRLVSLPLPPSPHPPAMPRTIGRQLTPIDKQPTPAPVAAAAAVAAPAPTASQPSHPGYGGLVLYLAPEPRAGEPTKQAWGAILTVWCPGGVPHVVRDGFFRAAGYTLEREASCSSYRALDRQDPAYGDFRYARVWAVDDDMSGGRADESERRFARLEVLAADRDVLARFPVDELKPRQIAFAMAWNPAGQLVYCYDYATEPAWDIHCIPQDLPLSGWWSWPRGR